ncbi:MAG: type II secretion system minor pseudopilin GspK [Gallionella sp.]
MSHLALPRHLTLPRHQHGVAVITALLLTTLAITIVTSLFWQQQVQVRSIENQRLQLQKQWVLRGALDWAALILREDAKHSSIDTLDEPWAVPLAETRLDQYVEDGQSLEDESDASLSGGIMDAQARYNLTNLCPNGTIDPAEVAVFARLLAHAGLDSTLSQSTAELMAATFPNPDALSPDAENNAQQPAQFMAFIHVEDLLTVPGFTPQALAVLQPNIIFLPRATPVNLNTATAEVLSARLDTLSLAEAAALIESRNTASFRDIADFKLRLPGKTVSLTPKQASVTTNYFLVNGKVRISRAELEMQALIERETYNTKLIRIREY